MDIDSQNKNLRQKIYLVDMENTGASFHQNADIVEGSEVVLFLSPRCAKLGNDFFKWAGKFTGNVKFEYIEACGQNVADFVIFVYAAQKANHQTDFILVTHDKQMHHAALVCSEIFPTINLSNIWDTSAPNT